MLEARGTTSDNSNDGSAGSKLRAKLALEDALYARGAVYVVDDVLCCLLGDEAPTRLFALPSGQRVDTAVRLAGAHPRSTFSLQADSDALSDCKQITPSAICYDRQNDCLWALRPPDELFCWSNAARGAPKRVLSTVALAAEQQPPQEPTIANPLVPVRQVQLELLRSLDRAAYEAAARCCFARCLAHEPTQPLSSGLLFAARAARRRVDRQSRTKNTAIRSGARRQHHRALASCSAATGGGACRRRGRADRTADDSHSFVSLILFLLSLTRRATRLRVNLAEAIAHATTTGTKSSADDGMLKDVRASVLTGRVAPRFVAIGELLQQLARHNNADLAQEVRCVALCPAHAQAQACTTLAAGLPLLVGSPAAQLALLESLLTAPATADRLIDTLVRYVTLWWTPGE